jgi:hypothetical protein
MDDRSAHRLQRRGSRSAYQDGGSLFSLVLALAAGRPVFSETEYTQVAGKVVDIFDLSDATRVHVLTQADPAKQVLLPVAGVGYPFTGTQSYLSNRAAATVDYCHNGTGFESTLGYERKTSLAGVQILAATNQLGTATGYAHWLNNTPSARMYVTDGAGPISSIGASSVGLDTPTHSTVVYDESLTSGTRVRVYLKSTLGVQANPAAPPNAGAPNTALCIGAATSGGFFVGNLRYGIYSPTLSDAQRAAKFSAIQELTGIAP